MALGRPIVRGRHGERAAVAEVERILEEMIEGREPARQVARDRLSVDLLEAEEIGLEAAELRPQHGDALRESRDRAGLVVEALEVEGSDTQPRHLSSAAPSNPAL